MFTDSPWNYFTRKELSCRCGRNHPDSWKNMDNEMMIKLVAVRRETGIVMDLMNGSAYRCPEHNVEVASTGLSGPHTTGHAVDIPVRGHQAYSILFSALRHGFTGIGVSQKGGSRFIHLDDLPFGVNRPRPWVWSY